MHFSRTHARVIKHEVKQFCSQQSSFAERFQVRGAAEHVISGGRVAVFEYRLNTTPGQRGKRVDTPAYPSMLYDALADYEKSSALAAAPVARDTDGPVAVSSTAAAARPSRKDPEGFGVTTPRRSGQAPELNQRLGVYQRALSAHGVRNQQDSTFSLSGGTPGENQRRASVKVNAPPGGGGGSFW